MPEKPQPQIFNSLSVHKATLLFHRPPPQIPNSPSDSSKNYTRPPSAGRESALEPSHRRSHFYHSIHSSSRPSLHLRNLDLPRRHAEPHLAPHSSDLTRRSFRH